MNGMYEPHHYPDHRFPIIFHRDYLHSVNHLADPPPNVSDIIGEGFRTHWHEGVEILQMLKGNARININEEALSVGVGDVIVFNSNRLHRITAEKECLYRCLIINREICQGWGYDLDELEFQPLLQDERINALFDTIDEEDEGKRPQYKSIIMASCLTLMALLSRHYTVTEPLESAASVRKRALVRQVIGYINRHYEEAITLERVSATFGYSRYYLAHVFAEQTGLPMMEYLQQTRMNTAATLLAEGGSIAEIATQCGYQNASAFSAAFRRRYGCSPGQFRRRTKED